MEMLELPEFDLAIYCVAGHTMNGQFLRHAYGTRTQERAPGLPHRVFQRPVVDRAASRFSHGDAQAIPATDELLNGHGLSACASHAWHLQLLHMATILGLLNLHHHGRLRRCNPQAHQDLEQSFEDSGRDIALIDCAVLVLLRQVLSRRLSGEDKIRLKTHKVVTCKQFIDKHGKRRCTGVKSALKQSQPDSHSALTHVVCMQCVSACKPRVYTPEFGSAVFEMWRSDACGLCCHGCALQGASDLLEVARTRACI
jgi:hypothetical protein